MKYLQIHRPKGRFPALRIREKAHPFAPVKSEEYVRRGGIIEIFGVQASGKTRMIERIREASKELWRFPLVYVKATDSLADIYSRNVGAPAKSSKAGEQFFEDDDVSQIGDKWDILYEKATKAVVIIDDADKMSGKKLEICKELCRRSKRIVYSSQSETSINRTLYTTIQRRKMKKHTIQLTSTASYDASNWFLMALIAFLAFTGMPEAAVIIVMARLAMHGTSGVR